MFDIIRNEGRLLFEGIRGSHLHGLNTETSDIDHSGIFIAPEDQILGLRVGYVRCVESKTKDDVWNELEKLFEELAKSNESALETLYTPKELTLHYDSVLDPLFNYRDNLITKRCFHSFGHYALSQIKKAKGLKKLINIDPEEMKVRKSILHFCIVLEGVKTIPLNEWLEREGLDEKNCGLSKCNRGVELYALYYDATGTKGYRGLYEEGSTQLKLTAIPKGEEPICTFQFNIDAFSGHCRDYKRYWEWVDKRNQERYELEKGYNFNAKNISNAVRLCTMAKELANGEGMILNRAGRDKDFLLSIKNHECTFDEIIKYIENLRTEMLEAFEKSKLPEEPDKKELQNILVKIRKEFYSKK